MSTEEKYCNNCGSEDLAFKENYACGQHFICRECNEELCFNHEKEEE